MCMSVELTPRLETRPIASINPHKFVQGLVAGRHYVSACLKDQSKITTQKIRFWDLLNQNEGSIKYSITQYSAYTTPLMRAGPNTCFFADTTPSGGILGAINAQTDQLMMTPYEWKALSVQGSKGVTLGAIHDNCRLIFWDLLTMQETATFDGQGCHQCAMLPSPSSDFVVSLQSSSAHTPNLLALWDRRLSHNPIKKKYIPSIEERDIYSMVIIDTLQGPQIVTRSRSHPMIAIRSIFDEVFGEIINTYDSRCGELIRCAHEPDTSKPRSYYGVFFHPTSDGKLETVTSEITNEVTVRTYDFHNASEKMVKPDLEIRLTPYEHTPAIPKDSYARDEEKVVFAQTDSQTGKTQLVSAALYKKEK